MSNNNVWSTKLLEITENWLKFENWFNCVVMSVFCYGYAASITQY